MSPHRALRPWQGAVEDKPRQQQESYDPKCYLCPGNERVSSSRNPQYTNTFSFGNDFPALLADPVEESSPHNAALSTEAPSFIRLKRERGECRVVCFSPEHNLTMSDLSVEQIARVIEAWREQTADLMEREWISHVMVFENKGAMMGCSNPHPHGQIWATESVPVIPAREAASQRSYYNEKKSRLLVEYAEWEHQQQERIVFQNDSWIAVVPFWAVWPFETLVIPRRDRRAISDLTAVEIQDWAVLLKALLTCYDNLFSCSFPYSMGVYQAPRDRQLGATQNYDDGFQLNQKFFPPLLRSADVKKHMVGFELCAEAQRDITPESAAERLRAAMRSSWKESNRGCQSK